MPRADQNYHQQTPRQGKTPSIHVLLTVHERTPVSVVYRCVPIIQRCFSDNGMKGVEWGLGFAIALDGRCSKQGDILALRLTWLQAMDAQRTFKTPDIIDRTATPREPQEINNASQIRIKCLRPGSKDTELLAPENGFRRSGAIAKKKNGKQSTRIMQELQRHVYVSESTTTIKGFSN